MTEINKRQAADEERIVRIKRLVAPELADLDEIVSAFQVRDKSDVSETLSHLDLIDHAEQRVLIVRRPRMSIRPWAARLPEVALS